MRLVFAATGDIALPAFRRLLAEGRAPLALITQPDKPVGRHQILTPPRIKTEALQAGIPVMQPEKIGQLAPEIRQLGVEILVVMAYGQILRGDILDLPGLAVINLHASLLPRHRGAACIQAAIDAGDARTGITAMHVARGLDCGDIITARSLDISPQETAGSLHERLADLAAEVLGETLDALAGGCAGRTPQDDTLATHAPKLLREHGRIDWTRPALEIERRIRAYHPWPGTFTVPADDPAGRRLKLFPPCRVIDSPVPVPAPGHLLATPQGPAVACGEQALLLGEVQADGGRRIPAADFFRGHPQAAFA